VKAALFSCALAVCLLVGGCSRGCSKSKSSSADAAEVDAGASRVEMISTGRAPRAILQVARWKGLSYRMLLENDAAIGAPGQLPLRGPILLTTLRIDVVRGSAAPIVRDVSGRKLSLIEERATVEKVEVKPGQMGQEAILQANRNLEQRFVGTTTRQLVSEDGEIVEIKTELVAGQPPTPEVKRALDDTWDVQRRFPFRLPRIPVGVGAHWRFADPIELNGVRAMQIADMQVADMDATRVRIRIRLRQQAPRQEIPHPVDPNDTAMLERYRGDGEGELVMDKVSAVLLDARLTTTASLEVSAFLDGQPSKRSFLATTRFVCSGGVLDADAGARHAADAGSADSGP
jgi:hypothetical protein